MNNTRRAKQKNGISKASPAFNLFNQKKQNLKLQQTQEVYFQKANDQFDLGDTFPSLYCASVSE